jgi:hypothetical protein
MHDRPISRLLLKFLGIVHEHTCYFRVLRVLRFGCSEEGLEREERGFDRENRRPG